MCPHSIIVGDPEPFFAITLPTSSIWISSNPKSSHLSAKNSAIGFSLSEGVYNFSAFSNILVANFGVTVKCVSNSYLSTFNA